ncbi:MAG: transposase [Deltaproteobacteria bacterium]|nr:transposase [Deltaproteobacteria bacterium]
MPRLARLDAPGVFHHVMIRGIERRDIFWNEADREDFLGRLSTLLPETGTACLGWALLSNHAHLLFRTGNAPLSKLMRRLLTGYVLGFNRRHQRNGQLFQNRFKSIVCQENMYLKELVRYVHLNPIRAGLVSDLEELNTYPYCGHSALSGNRERPWQNVDYVLGWFGDEVDAAGKAYQLYMKEGLPQGRREDLAGGGLIRSLGGWSEVKRLRSEGRSHTMSDQRILGDSDFVESILSGAGEKVERRYELKALGYDLNRIAEKAARLYGMELHEVFSKGRQDRKVKARSLVCYWAVRELGMSMSDLARKFGMSISGVGYAVNRGERISHEYSGQLMD